MIRFPKKLFDTTPKEGGRVDAAWRGEMLDLVYKQDIKAHLQRL